MRVKGIRVTMAAFCVRHSCQPPITAARFPIVSAIPTGADRQAAATRTLGDLLSADKAKAQVPETEWVALVRAVAAGDQSAFRALYERAHPIVFTLVMRITANRHAADELTIDVFHHVWRQAATYDPMIGSVLGWIMNQARSRALDHLRYERRKKRVGPDQDDSSNPARSDDAQAAVELRDQTRILQAALTALSPEERQAIELAFFSDLTQAETAARLSQPLGTIKTRIRSGLEKLRRAFNAPTETP
jgi:RNA polymerase sigma-70 factor (ECF subfamily)